MRHRVAMRAALNVVGVLLLAGALPGSSAGQNGTAQPAGPPRQHLGLPGGVDRLVQAFDRTGFAVQEGSIRYIDTVKEACQKHIPDALGNNPWPNAYLALIMPPPRGSTYPLPFEWTWQLREDEAIVFVGRTPPPAAYFSYQTWVAFLPGDISLGQDGTPVVNTRRSVPVGDTTNIATIRTRGFDHANQQIVYVVTGNRTTESRVRSVIRTAGYPDQIVNIERISSALAPLGIGPTGSVFFLAQRVAAPDDEQALEAYIKSPPYRAFRVTPRSPLAPDPEPVPVLRTRGTGHTEMALWPAVKRLRQAILDREQAAHPDLTVRELVPRIWQTTLPATGQAELLEKPWVGLQVGSFVWAATRDTNYFQTPYFMLREGVLEYVLIYGVNHQKTGKATYANVSVYLDPNQASGRGREFGLGTRLDRDFGDSARQYLPDDPQADMLYVLKLARACNGEPYCLEVRPPSQLDMNGVHYDCDPPIDLDAKVMYAVTRGYMEPETGVGPDDNELVWDRGVYVSADPKP